MPDGWKPAGAKARQIITGTVCHLEASMVRKALEGWDLAELDYLFIENVGNLVCPASFDLGEHLRVLLFPVTEGEDKPLKYPTLINTADVTLISKIDLAEAVGSIARSPGKTSTSSARGGRARGVRSHRRGAGGLDRAAGTTARSSLQPGARSSSSTTSGGQARTSPRERRREFAAMFDQGPPAGRAGAVPDSGEGIESDMFGAVWAEGSALPGWGRWAIARAHARIDPCGAVRSSIPTQARQSP